MNKGKLFVLISALCISGGRLKKRLLQTITAAPILSEIPIIPNFSCKELIGLNKERKLKYA